MNRIRKARQRVADLYAKTAEAQPGEVWTTYYSGTDFKGNPFDSYTAGEVRILGEECPVVEYRGRKTLGEADLDPEDSWPWTWVGRAYLFCSAMAGIKRGVERGDTAPNLSEAHETAFLAREHAGGFLATLPNGSCVTVEYRDEHPVYAGQRNVVTGTTYDHDTRGGEAGRDIGGDWVPFAQVTAVLLHDHAEVTS